MKNLRRLLLLACLIPAAASTVAPAVAEGLYLAPEVAYVLPTNGVVDDTVFVGGRAGWAFTPSWSVEIESGWMEYGWDVSANTNVDVTTIPIIANVRYSQRCDEGSPGWYLFGGVGAGINEMDSNRVNADVDNTVIWQAGVGGELPISTTANAFVDVRYFYNNAEVNAGDTIEAVKDDVDASAVMFTGGVRF